MATPEHPMGLWAGQGLREHWEYTSPQSAAGAGKQKGNEETGKTLGLSVP